MVHVVQMKIVQWLIKSVVLKELGLENAYVLPILIQFWVEPVKQQLVCFTNLRLVYSGLTE